MEYSNNLSFRFGFNSSEKLLSSTSKGRERIMKWATIDRFGFQMLNRFHSRSCRQVSVVNFLKSQLAWIMHQFFTFHIDPSEIEIAAADYTTSTAVTVGED